MAFIISIAGIQLQIRRPIVWFREGKSELTLRLAESKKLIPIPNVEGYQRRIYSEADNIKIVEILNICGFNFNESILDKALKMCVPEGVHLVEHVNTGRIVSMMMSRHLSSDEFPFGGRIDWLATDPAHRGKGLGSLVASMATNHLIDRCYKNIWVTTQASRPGAIKIFTSLGFIPTEQTLLEHNWQEIKRSVTLKENKF